MILHRTGARSIEILTPAKVNLFLEILGKRPDGYHEVDTVLHAVGIYDVLRLELLPGRETTFELTVSGLDAGPVEDNLALRAARAFAPRLVPGCGVRMHLEKVIPPGAGLGGGSSDAAAVLAGLNRLSPAPRSREETAVLGAEIGSDVPFFCYGGTARCTGRGERVEPIPGVPVLNFLVVFPGIRISTRGVYGKLNLTLTEARKKSKLLLNALGTGDAETINRCLYNRLEQPALEYEPSLSEAITETRNLDYPWLRITGSGSAFFQLLEGHSRHQEKLRFFRNRAGWRTFLAKSAPWPAPSVQKERP